MHFRLAKLYNFAEKWEGGALQAANPHHGVSWLNEILDLLNENTFPTHSFFIRGQTRGLIIESQHPETQGPSKTGRVIMSQRTLDAVVALRVFPQTKILRPRARACLNNSIKAITLSKSMLSMAPPMSALKRCG